MTRPPPAASPWHSPHPAFWPLHFGWHQTRVILAQIVECGFSDSGLAAPFRDAHAVFGLPQHKRNLRSEKLALLPGDLHLQTRDHKRKFQLDLVQLSRFRPPCSLVLLYLFIYGNSHSSDKSVRTRELFHVLQLTRSC